MLTGNTNLGRVGATSRLVPYITLLVISKCLRSLGLCLAYDVLKVVHLIIFVFLIKAGSAALLLPIQRPFSSGKRLTKRQWIGVFRHAFFGALITLLWIFGLTLCGTVRTILLFEHSDVVVSAAVAALFTGRGGGPSRTRGAFVFLTAILSLLLFDADRTIAQVEHPEGHHSSAITHIFYQCIAWLGVSDHRGGVLLLVLMLCVNVAYKNTSRKLSVDIGGSKRLHAYSTLLQAVMLLPWALFHMFIHDSQVLSWWSLLAPLAVIVLVVFIVDYYVESVCTNRLDIFKTSRLGAYALFTSALLLAYLWSGEGAASAVLGQMGQGEAVEHGLSGGVVFSTLLFMLATRVLGFPIPKANTKGSLVGYTAGGLPLYNFTGDALHRTSQSIMTISKNILRQILEEYDSRQIFYYLCINLAFTFIELAYGAWTNSLGLISDGFHMLFDCTALVVGLSAAVMSRWKATRIFSYGYGRVEVLSGYVNGLFLVVIACFVFIAAIGRLLDPPEINSERLLTVSIAGLLVNMIGIFAFSHAHSHAHKAGGGGACSQSHGGGGHAHSSGHHGHSHNSLSHSHDARAPAKKTTNSNMQGVFLHVLADTLGSVGVIVSSFLIGQFGLLVADPICSIFIAVMIFLSVLPLLGQTAAILVQRIPPELESSIADGLKKVKLLDDVLSYREHHFWCHSADSYAGTLHVQVTAKANEQKVIQQVAAIFKECSIQNFSVQVEKEAYYQHLSGLSVTFDQLVETTQQLNAIGQQDDTLHDIKAV
ncbi:zinc transporter 5-like [Acanthaster planci]|uniref:Proton-coupled zinc antiporter SLC30A5 n=1 Tax=Acanthaster planci TaxID=133434 RepID=A0A8B7ZGA8_ACAPL|nr:zinc transporter 5-like [Acanthaster planci]